MTIAGNAPDLVHGPVPDDLARLVNLLNTIDVEVGIDQLADQEALDAWLGADASVCSAPGDLEVARQLRGGLRALAAQNCGQDFDDGALVDIVHWTGRLPVSVQLVVGGSAIVVGGEGAASILGGVLASYVRAVEQGRWSRVKLCASPSCRWAFWDGSKNRSRRWCAMSVCGSRAKMRGYRQRSRRSR